MKVIIAAIALLLLAGCASAPRRCDRHFTRINAPSSGQARTVVVHP